MMDYAKPKNLSWTLLNEQLVILDSREKKVFHELNGVASDLWEWLDEVETKEDLVQRVLEKYDVEVRQVEIDIEQFFADLLEKKLLEKK